MASQMSAIAAAAAPHVRNGAARTFFIVAPSLVGEMRRGLPAQTDAAVMAVLGISWTTWLKVRDGRPILRSTAVRLVTRFMRSTEEEIDPYDHLLPVGH